MPRRKAIAAPPAAPAAPIFVSRCQEQFNKLPKRQLKAAQAVAGRLARLLEIKASVQKRECLKKVRRDFKHPTAISPAHAHARPRVMKQRPNRRPVDAKSKSRKKSKQEKEEGDGEGAARGDNEIIVSGPESGSKLRRWPTYYVPKGRPVRNRNKLGLNVGAGTVARLPSADLERRKKILKEKLPPRLHRLPPVVLRKILRPPVLDAVHPVFRNLDVPKRGRRGFAESVESVTPKASGFHRGSGGTALSGVRSRGPSSAASSFNRDSAGTSSSQGSSVVRQRGPSSTFSALNRDSSGGTSSQVLSVTRSRGPSSTAFTFNRDSSGTSSSQVPLPVRNRGPSSTASTFNRNSFGTSPSPGPYLFRKRGPSSILTAPPALIRARTTSDEVRPMEPNAVRAVPLLARGSSESASNPPHAAQNATRLASAFTAGAGPPYTRPRGPSTGSTSSTSLRTLALRREFSGSSLNLSALPEDLSERGPPSLASSIGNAFSPTGFWASNYRPEPKPEHLERYACNVSISTLSSTASKTLLGPSARTTLVEPIHPFQGIPVITSNPDAKKAYDEVLNSLSNMWVRYMEYQEKRRSEELEVQAAASLKRPSLRSKASKLRIFSSSRDTPTLKRSSLSNVSNVSAESEEGSSYATKRISPMPGPGCRFSNAMSETKRADILQVARMVLEDMLTAFSGPEDAPTVDDYVLWAPPILREYSKKMDEEEEWLRRCYNITSMARLRQRKFWMLRKSRKHWERSAMLHRDPRRFEFDTILGLQRHELTLLKARRRSKQSAVMPAIWHVVWASKWVEWALGLWDVARGILPVLEVEEEEPQTPGSPPCSPDVHQDIHYARFLHDIDARPVAAQARKGSPAPSEVSGGTPTPTAMRPLGRASRAGSREMSPAPPIPPKSPKRRQREGLAGVPGNAPVLDSMIDELFGGKAGDVPPPVPPKDGGRESDVAAKRRRRMAVFVGGGVWEGSGRGDEGGKGK